MVAMTGYTGVIYAKKVDKTELVEIHYGQLNTAPLIKDCPINIECRVFDRVELPTTYVFIVEVVGVHAKESILSDGHPNPEKIMTFILSMPDNLFLGLGNCVGRAWQVGKRFNKKFTIYS